MKNSNETGCCGRIDRRRFLGTSAVGTVAAITAPAWLPSVSWAGTAGPSRDTPVVGFLRGVVVDSTRSKTMSGGPACVPVPDPGNFTMPGQATTATARRNALHAMNLNEPAPLGPAALDTFSTMDLLAMIDFAHYVPAN